jgi:hypothetical protein
MRYIINFIILLSFFSCSLFKQSNTSNNRETKILIFLEDDKRVKEQEIFLEELKTKAKQYNISIIYDFNFPENFEVENKIQAYFDFPKRKINYGRDSRFYTYLDELILQYQPDEIAVFDMIYWDKKNSSTYLNIYNVMQSQFYNFLQSRHDADDLLSDLLKIDLSNRPMLNPNKFFKNTIEELKCQRLEFDSESLGHLYTPEDINKDLEILNKYLLRINSFINISKKDGSFDNYISKLENENNSATNKKTIIEEIYHNYNYYPLKENNVWLYDVQTNDGKNYSKRIEVISYWMNQAHLLKESYNGLSKLETYYVLIWDNLKGVLFETGRNIGSDDFNRFQYSNPILQFAPSSWQYDLNNITHSLNYDHIDSLTINNKTYLDITHITEINQKDIKKDYFYANKIGLVKLDEFDIKNSKIISSATLSDYSLATK